MVMLLTGGGQGGKGSAMEAVFQRNDGGILRALFVRGVFAGDFDGALVGCCAGIGPKNGRKTAPAL